MSYISCDIFNLNVVFFLSDIRSVLCQFSVIFTCYSGRLISDNANLELTYHVSSTNVKQSHTLYFITRARKLPALSKSFCETALCMLLVLSREQKIMALKLILNRPHLIATKSHIHEYLRTKVK